MAETVSSEVKDLSRIARLHIASLLPFTHVTECLLICASLNTLTEGDARVLLISWLSTSIILSSTGFQILKFGRGRLGFRRGSQSAGRVRGDSRICDIRVRGGCRSVTLQRTEIQRRLADIMSNMAPALGFLGHHFPKWPGGALRSVLSLRFLCRGFKN
jgi:hypothetical protein